MNTSILNIKNLFILILTIGISFIARSQNTINRIENIENNIKTDSLGTDNNDILSQYDSIVNFYKRTENYDSLIVYINKIAQSYLKQNDLKKYVNEINAAAYFHTFKGEDDKSAEILLDNLRFAKNNNLDSEQSSIYMYLGFAYRKFDQNKALDFFNLCLKNEPDTLSRYYSSSLNEIANIYNLNGKHEKALDFYLRSLKIREGSPRYQQSQELAFSYHDISNAYQYLQNYEKAIFYMLKCIETAKNWDKNKSSKYYFCIFYSTLASQYFASGQYNKAQDYLKKALVLAKELNNHFLLELTYQRYYNFYKKTDNPLKALENFELAVLYRDSANRKEIAKTIADLDKKYQTEKKEAEISILKKENYIRGLSFAFSLALLVVIAAAAILIISKQIKIRKAKEALNKKLKKELEYKKMEVLNFSSYVKQRIAFTADIITNLKKINTDSEEVKDEIGKVISFISLNYQNEQKIINEVYSQIEDVNKVFSYRIKKKHHNLTNEDIRLASLLILNLSSKEIADVLFISVKSVEMKRYRLRKKLELKKDISLIDYLAGI